MQFTSNDTSMYHENVTSFALAKKYAEQLGEVKVDCKAY